MISLIALPFIAAGATLAGTQAWLKVNGGDTGPDVLGVLGTPTVFLSFSLFSAAAAVRSRMLDQPRP
jgi:hypothetical protein